jgi:hypothetical protein
MKFNKRNLIGIWNIVLALIFLIDKLIEKGTITPLHVILWTGLLLSGIYVIYENTKKNKVEKKH